MSEDDNEERKAKGGKARKEEIFECIDGAMRMEGELRGMKSVSPERYESIHLI